MSKDSSAKYYQKKQKKKKKIKIAPNKKKTNRIWLRMVLKSS